EDGIRDRTVTGVQTCALPISTLSSRHATGDQQQTNSRISFSKVPLPVNAGACQSTPGRGSGFCVASRFPAVSAGGKLSCSAKARSEERRVGKEGRCPEGGRLV